jgi:hypothetical protein
MKYENNDRLREYLDRGAAGAYREHLHHPRFEFNEEAFGAALDQVCAQFPSLSPEDAEARAAFRMLTSGVAPEVAVPLPSRWFRVTRFVREKSVRSWPWLKLGWAVAVLILCATAVALLSALVARAEPTPQNLRAYRNALRGVNLLALPAAQQPSGLILQFQQGGSALATRPAGFVALNCSTGLICSFSGTTFTLTSTGAGGSGCLPPGTPTRLLYDDGAGGCLDSGLTWTSGTSTATAPSGVTLTYSGSGVINARQWASTGITNTESLGKIPIGNGDGTATWSDPFVSGITPHDAVATSTNPVLTGGYASATAPTDVSADGDAVRAWHLRNGSQVFNLASGGTLVTLGQKAMSSSLPVTIASDQSAVPVSGTVTTTPPANASANLTQLNSVALASPFDADTGAGTQNIAGVSLRKSASGGSVELGTSSDPMRIDPTGTTTQPVSGSGNFTVVQGTGTNLHTVLDSGTLTSITNSVTVAGAKTNNNAAPGATNIGILGCIANAAQQTWTEGNQVLESCNLKGSQRMILQDAAGNDRGINVTSGNAAQADLTSVAGTATVTDGTAGVQAIGGHIANNATAAGTNKVPVMIGIAQQSYANGTAYTQGRDVVPDVFTDGALHVAALPAMRPASFHASSSIAGSSTTVMSNMPGNASNTVLVTRLMFSCTQTTAGTVTVTVIKTSAAATGGTSANMTLVPDDSNYSAPASQPHTFTGTGPTVGTPVGQVDAYKLGCNATNTAGANDVYILNLRQKPIVLRGTAQTLEIGTGGAITGGNITVTWEWIETTTITP